MITFDDANIVYRGLHACVDDLRSRREQYHAYVLPDKIGVIEVGDLGYREPAMIEQLASMEAYLYATESLDQYRKWVIRINAIPGVRLAGRMRLALLRLLAVRSAR